LLIVFHYFTAISALSNEPIIKEVEERSIFGKINRLNEALRDVNPKYKPIGFSITSIQSCSPSILKDAISATETAVSTLMSIIGEC